MVLAGTNGAGKSSIGGAFLRQAGGRYFNPDEIARAMRVADPSLDVAAANGRAWATGRRLLEQAIRERHDFALETTLGGRTITGLLLEALRRGFEVRVWYAGLATPGCTWPAWRRACAAVATTSPSRTSVGVTTKVGGIWSCCCRT